MVFFTNVGFMYSLLEIKYSAGESYPLHFSFTIILTKRIWHVSQFCKGVNWPTLIHDSKLSLGESTKTRKMRERIQVQLARQN